MWICANVEFHKWAITQMSSCAKDPSNRFGYRRLAYEKDIQYDEFMPSEENEVDTNKAAQVQGSITTTTQTPAKGPTLKPATLVTSSITPELLIAASSTTNPTSTPGRTPRSIRTSMVSQCTEGKASNTLISAKGSPCVAKASLSNGTLVKAKPKPGSGILPLHLTSGSALPKLIESQTRDSSPSKTVAERKRKQTNAREITDEEPTEIKGSLAKMRQLVTHLQVKGAKKSENEEIMERYVWRCEKAIESGKGVSSAEDPANETGQTETWKARSSSSEGKQSKETGRNSSAYTIRHNTKCSKIYDGSAEHKMKE